MVIGVFILSNLMSLFGDFLDIQDFIIIKFVYLFLKFKIVYVVVLLDFGLGIYVILLLLYNMLIVFVQ